MSFKKIACDMLFNHIFAGLQGIEIVSAHFSGNLVAYVQKLADMEIVIGTRLIMGDGISELAAGPAAYLRRRRQFGAVDINDGGVVPA